MELNKRAVRRVCDVKGCHSMVGAAAYSRSREAGGTPILCEACAKAIGRLVGLVEPAPVAKKETPHPSPSPKEGEVKPAKKTSQGAKSKKEGK